MKNKIKALVYSTTVFAMRAPMVVFGATTGFNVPTAGADTGNLKATSVGDVLKTILNYALSIVGIGGVIGFVVAGMMYLTAAGDEKKIGSAKNIMLYSIVGVVVALIGLIAVNAISTIFISNTGTAY